MIHKAAHATYRTARRIAVLAVGSTVVMLGVIMLVAPGPGLVVIPLGLVILGLEFAWARAWLRRLRERISSRSSRSQAERAELHRERVRRRTGR